jgi:hypothetical protein
MMKKVLVILAAGLMAGGSVAKAAMIGVNLGSDQQLLTAAELAGVVAQVNWNNASGSSGDSQQSA